MPNNYASGRSNTSRWFKYWEAYCGKLGTDSTHHGIIQAPCPQFTKVRILLRNHIISTQPTVTRVLGAVTSTSATTTNQIVPSTGNTVTGNSATGWTEMLWNGVANPTLGAVLNTTVSGIADVAFDGSYDFSDWADIKSIPPTDGLGNGNPYFMWRCYIPGAGSYTWWPLSNNATDRSREDWLQVYANSGGTGVTNPSSVTTGTAIVRTNIAGVEFLDTPRGNRHVNILCIGDSITQGFATSTSFRSWSWMAEKTMKSLGVPANFLNYGWVGTATANYCLYGKTAVDMLKPNYVIYSAYSPNNTPVSQPIFDAQFNDLVDFDNYCKARGIEVIFGFYLPDDFFSGPQDSARQQYIKRVKAAYPDRTFDCNPFMSAGGADPQKINPIYAAGDSLHANDAGNDAEGVFIGQYMVDYINRKTT